MHNFFLAGLLFLFSVEAEAANAKINGVTYSSSGNSTTNFSNSSADQTLRLKRVFLFPTLDDVSGVIAPKLDQKIAELFAKNTRFDLVRDKDVIKALSPEDGGYGKATQSKEVHKEAARLTKADTTAILRTRNVGSNAEMTLELRGDDGELLYSESASVPGYSPVEARWTTIEKIFDTVVKKIPFHGTVTGRTGNTLTIDLGIGKIRQGAEIELARIVSIQRHPLLKTVVGTDYVRVGRAKVTTVDKSLSFAEILEEFQGESVGPGNKIVMLQAGGGQQLSVPTEPEKRSVRGEFQEPRKEEDPFADRLKGEFDTVKPRFGQVGVNVQYGSITHTQASLSTTPLEASGSGIGGDVAGELWITRYWILQLGYGFQNAALSSAGVEVGDASWRRIELFGGFRFFPNTMGDGTSITGSLGYQSLDFVIPTSSATSLGGRKYKGPALRVTGEMAFLPGQKIVAGFGFQPFTTMTETGASLGTPSGGTVIGLQLAWDYHFAEQLFLRLGLQFDSANGSYENSSSVTDKRFAIGPGIHYSF